ncbi:hypothetical protein MRB53_029721 [Persea americana]|uniref:Uncharacterized protein n=1 Tax=Persea americana TaxID=3435 RepID=A0ACC2KJ44_PERAE|nr:hypothetical protein MRB53_029721 [Persea americana]
MGRRRIERQGRGWRGRRERRRGGRRGCDVCAGGREEGRGVPGDEGGGNGVALLHVGRGCCVRLAEVGALLSVDERGELEEGRRDRDLGRRDGEERSGREMLRSLRGRR